jgi:hypothetical protein
VRCKRHKSANKPTAAPYAACAPLLLEVGGAQRVGQDLSGLNQDSLVSLNVSGGETIERCGDKQGTHQAADLVENGYGKTSGTLDIFGQRQIQPCSPGLVDTLHQLIAIEDGAGCDSPKIGRPEKSLPPVGGLKCHQHNTEGAMQRNFPGKRLDDRRSLRTKAPVDHDSLASLQNGKAAVFARCLGQTLDVRMGDLQQPSKRVERRGQWKEPCAQPVFAIFKPLQNSIFDQRASNAGDGRDGQSDALADLRH